MGINQLTDGADKVKRVHFARKLSSKLSTGLGIYLCTKSMRARSRGGVRNLVTTTRQIVTR